MLKANIHLSKGRVIAALPYRNHYLVSCDDSDVLAVSLDSGGSRRGGVSGSPAYLPGTFVLVAFMNETAAPVANAGFPHIILGAFTPFSKPEDTEFSLLTGVTGAPNGVPGGFVGPLSNIMSSLLIEADPIRVLNADYSHKRSLDAVAGEWSQGTSLGGNILLSEFMTALSANPGCIITLDSESRLAEVLAERHRTDSPHFLSEVYNKIDSVYAHRQFAFNTLEGLGAGYNKAAFKKDEDDLDVERCAVKEEKQAAFFRRTLFEGGGVEGSLDAYRIDTDQGRDVYLNEDEDIVLPGLLSEAKRMDGTYRIKAAKEFKIEKTPVISVPQQINEAMTTEISEADANAFDSAEERKYGKTDLELKESEYDLDEDKQFLYNSFIQQDLASFDEQELFNRGLRKDGGVWVFKDRADVSKDIFGKEIDYVYKLPVLRPDQNEYDLDNLLAEEIDAYPGRKVKLFANSSVFLMADDGGIVLGDGYGGEIRMQRGKVTISSIGDIEMLPGRDLVEYVGRNRITRAKKRVDISSSEDSVSIKAEENMQLLSGNGGRGSCTIENRGTGGNLTDITNSNIENGDPLGQGVVIKSTKSGTGVAMLGNYIYGGGYDEKGNSSSGSVRSACNIILDSGTQGNTVMLGNTGNFLFESACSMGAANNAAGFYWAGTTLSMIAPGNILTASPAIQIDKGGGSVSKPRITSSGVQERSYTLPSVEPNVIMQGNLLVRRAIQAKEQVVSETGMFANDGFNGQFPAEPTFDVEIPDSVGSAIADVASVGTAAAVSILQAAANNIGIATDYGKKATGFGYPQTDSDAYNASDYSILAPKYHQVLQGGSKWAEKPVKNSILDSDTYPYPGESWFKSGAKAVKSAEATSSGIEENEISLNDWPING